MACDLTSSVDGTTNDKPYREKKQATCVFQFASVHERCKGLGIGSKPSESWTGNNHGACVTAVQTLFESCGPLFTAAPAAASARIQARRCLSAAAAVRAPAVRRVRALLRQLFTRFFVTAPVTGDWVRGDWVRRGGYRVSSGT